MTGAGGKAGEGWRSLAPFFAANVLFGAGLFAHAFLYNFYLEALGLGEGVMGMAAAALTAGGLTALAPAGLVLDRWGPRRTYLAAAGAGAAGLAWGALVQGPAWILAAAFLAGTGAAGWRVSMGPVLMAVAPDGVRSRAFSWNVGLLLASGALWTAGAASVPAWIRDVAGGTELDGLRVALLLGALGTLAAGPLFLAVPLAARDREPGAAGAGREVVRGVADRLRDILEGLVVPARVRRTVFWILVWMVGGGLVIPFFNLYFLRSHGLSVERIGLLFAAVQALTALAVFAGGDVAQRLGPRRAFAGWAALFPLTLVALALGLPIHAAVVLYALQGMVPPATNPLLDEVVLEEAGPSLHGAASSWRNGATELSGLIGAGVGGFLLEGASFPALFTAAAAVASVGAAALVVTFRGQGAPARFLPDPGPGR